MKQHAHAECLLRFFTYLFIAGMFPITAHALPKGDCANPKPYSDLRHCKLRGMDLKNKNLEGVDLRGVNLYQTKLQGANLTNALFHGRMITYAELDGVTGLPKEVLALLNKRYLVTPAPPEGYSLKPLPKDYSSSNISVAGLDNVNLAKKIPNTQTTVALLSYPKYGDSQFALILAQYDNDNFDSPVCYQVVNPFNDGEDYYYGHSDSLDVRALSNGEFLVGSLTSGTDGDGEGSGGWDLITLLKLTSACKLTILHKEYGNWMENYEATSCDGTHLDFRFIDDQTAEISMIRHTCGYPESKGKVTRKKIPLQQQN